VCDLNRGLSLPAPATLSAYCSLAEAAYASAGASAPFNPATQSVCELEQLVDGTGPNSQGVVQNPNDFDSTGSCVHSSAPGWCYVSGGAAAPCSQTIRFASGSPPAGATAGLVCVK
jgi:hypothetical protein